MSNFVRTFETIKMEVPRIKIRKNKLDSISRKHPWIFSGAIESDTAELKEGILVHVMNHRDQFLGQGHFQGGTIAVRVLKFEQGEVDQTFYDKMIQIAVSLRLKLNLLRAENTIFRLIHGEGDGLPGLVVDYYNGTAVIQCHSIGMYRSLDSVVEALKKALGDKLLAVYSKSSETLPERVDTKDGYLFGEVKMPHKALENGVNYAIDWVKGQKTGFFIDQRENRALLQQYSKGKKVLNTFCYSGGFSLAAIKGGATMVHSVDSSEKAIALTEENIELNQMGKNHKSIVADALEYMKNLEESYDVIVLDPPAFAKHRQRRHKAIQAYKRLNAYAIRQIKPGGLIFTFSCSQVVDKYLFNNTIVAAAIESGRQVRIINQLHQPADHPINAFHPEGEYLKGLVIEVN